MAISKMGGPFNAEDGQFCLACGEYNFWYRYTCVYCRVALPHHSRVVKAIKETARFNIATISPMMVTPSDDDLKRMGFREALYWAADHRGVFDLKRLLRVAKSKQYKPGWAYLLNRLTLTEALEKNEKYKRERGRNQ
jgi:hypothetical protein